MSFHALGIVVLILILTVAFLVYVYWPRNDENEMLSPDEVESFLNKFPDPDPSQILGKIIMVFAVIAMAAVAITSQHNHVDSSLDD